MRMPATFGALVALGALTALPACSMFGGDHGAATTSQYNEHSYTAPGSNASAANSQMAMNQQEVPTSPALVRKVQTQLKQNGDYNSRVDGVWGPMTENGVRKWQQGHNLQANGEIDMATLQSMNISADQNQANGTDNGTNTNNSQANNGQNNGSQPNGTNANPSANYNTAGNHQTGSNYSSNNGSQPATTPYPTNSGTNNGNTANGTNGNTNSTQH